MLESSPGCLELGGEDRGGEGAARGRRAGLWAERRARLGGTPRPARRDAAPGSEGEGGGVAVAESWRSLVR